MNNIINLIIFSCVLIMVSVLLTYNLLLCREIDRTKNEFGLVVPRKLRKFAVANAVFTAIIFILTSFKLLSIIMSTFLEVK